MSTAVSVPTTAPNSGALRAVLRSPLGLAASVIILVMIAAAILAPFIAPNNPGNVRLDMMNGPADASYWLGGDSGGRDIFSRLLFAARNTLLGALVAVGVAVLIGVTTGLIAGYFGRTFDFIAGWVSDALMALPSLIVLLAFFKVLGSSVYLSMAVFGVMLAPGFFRLTRNLVMGVRNELYVDAARVSGLSDTRIISRHILLVIRAPIVIQVAVVSGVAIVIQSGLEFLGLGDPRTPTWGGMLQDAFANIYVAPMSIVWPGLTISLTVASLVLLGNTMRDWMQKSSSGGHGARARARKAAALSAASAKSAAKPPADVLLRIADLVVGYETPSGIKEVVKGVSLDLKRGETLGLVGESGSGKTQTAFSVLGLLSSGGRVVSGSIVFDGQELTGLDEVSMHKLRGKRLAYVPQEPMSNLDPTFRIGFQLTEPMRAVLGISETEAKKRALALLARVGLPDPMRAFNAYPHEISGGMAQRVLIAGAVSCDPDLLIADEPTTALDVTVQAEVLQLLRDLKEEFDMSVILVTHNFGVVADSCDRVAVMRDGKVVEVNAVDALFAHPQHDYTKMLLGSTLENSTPPVYVPPSLAGVRA